MFDTGIKASDLVKQLQEAIKKHGDQQCFSGGTDYPSGVHGVAFNERGNAYEPEGCFLIH